MKNHISGVRLVFYLSSLSHAHADVKRISLCMDSSQQKFQILFRSVKQHGCHWHFLFLIGWNLKKSLLLWNYKVKLFLVWYKCVVLFIKNSYIILVQWKTWRWWAKFQVSETANMLADPNIALITRSGVRSGDHLVLKRSVWLIIQ